MTIPIKITCVSLNYQTLDEKSLKYLSNARIGDCKKVLTDFKKEMGFPIEQLAIIEKCNAVIIVLCYFEEVSFDYIRGRILSAWDKFSNGGILQVIKQIKFYENYEAVNYLAECAVGLHSVTLGDSQVLAQICSSLQSSDCDQPNSPTFSLLAGWLRDVTAEIKLRTQLLSNNTSLERIATEIVRNKIGSGESVTLIGYGRSGKLIAKILAEELGYSLNIANRSAGALKEINNNKINIIELSDYEKIMNSACIIVAIDSNKETQKYINNLVEKNNRKSVTTKLYIDMASPPLVKNLLGAEIVDIEYMSFVANKNINRRSADIEKARSIINKYSIIIMEKLREEIGRLSINRQQRGVVCRLSKTKIDLLEIRSEIYKSMRSYLDKAGFTEVTTPYIVGVSTDPPRVDKGGTINVFWPSGSRAFLRQSNQIYKQMIVASGVPKIYEIGPFWRAEDVQSYRHLQESIGLDIEMSSPKNLEELYLLAYSIILCAYKHISKNNKIKKSKIVLPHERSVPVITYLEAIKILNSKGYIISLGEDLGLVGESKLGQIIKRKYNSDAFIVRDYPDTIKKFYTKRKHGGITETFDIVISGWEIASGAIRETKRSIIEKSMALSGINTSNYNFYLSVIGGSVSHGGFGLGIDRLIAKFLDYEVVTDAVVFPRTYKNLVP